MCGTLPLSKEALEQRKIWARDAPGNVSQPITVNTYFHLIYIRDHSKKDFDNYMAQVGVVALQLYQYVIH